MANNISFNSRSDAALSQPVLEERSGESSLASKRRRIMTADEVLAHVELPFELPLVELPLLEKRVAMLSVIEKASQFYIECQKQEKIKKARSRESQWSDLFEGIVHGASEEEQIKAAKSLAILTNAFYSFHLQKLATKSTKKDHDRFNRQRWEAIDKAIAPGASKAAQEIAVSKLESVLLWRKKKERGYVNKAAKTKSQASKKDKTVSELDRSTNFSDSWSLHPSALLPNPHAMRVNESDQPTGSLSPWPLLSPSDLLLSSPPVGVNEFDQPTGSLSPWPLLSPSDLLLSSPLVGVNEFDRLTDFLIPESPVFSVASTPAVICSDLLPNRPTTSFEVTETKEPESSITATLSVETNVMLSVIQKASQCLQEQKESHIPQRLRWNVLSQGIAIGASEEEQTKAAESLVALAKSICPHNLQVPTASVQNVHQRQLWGAIYKGIASEASQEDQIGAVSTLAILLENRAKQVRGTQRQVQNS